MMQCQLCRDTGGPFEIIEYKKRCILVCEDCANKEKKNDTANIRNKRYVSRIPRTNSRNK